MSTTTFPEMAELRNVELLHNQEEGKITFVADLDEDSDVPPTEWITVAADATVDLEQHR
ncbi:MAG: hypothetical protein J07HX64_02451 [halophilic archaeon J07HX64]|jgi:hypothetical protein|nr:MAG: hypothetical protein J07HX64_02451 [halophilic archaeon J07HX64]